MEKEVRNNNILMIVVLSVMATIIVGLVCFIVYDKVISDDKQESNKIQDNGQNDGSGQIDDDEINDGTQEVEVDLMNGIVIKAMNPFLGNYDPEGFYFMSSGGGRFGTELFTDLISYKDLNDAQIANIIYHYADKQMMIDTSNLEELNDEDFTRYYGVLTVEQFKYILNRIFGNKVSYRNFNDDELGYCPNLAYHSDSDTYRVYGGCGGISSTLYSKEIFAVRNDHELKVTVQAFEGFNGTYSNFDYSNPFYVGTDLKISDIFDQYSSQIQKYRFVFTKDKGQYYFDHVEKVN